MDVSRLLAELKECTSMAALEGAKSIGGELVKLHSLELGMVIHSRAPPLLCSHFFVASTLVDMYSKCGSMEDAKRIFDAIAPNTVSWTALIRGYAFNGNPDECLHSLVQMHQEGCTPNSRTFAAALKACTLMAEKTREGKVNLRALETGMAIHSRAAGAGCDKNIFVAASLIDFYSKAGRLEDARRVFEKVVQPDVVLWNVFISGLAENGEGGEALRVFTQMRAQGCAPNGRSFVAAVKACSTMAVKEAGEQVHGKLVKVMSLENAMALHREAASTGHDSETFVATAMVDMYAKCGSLVDACRVFERVSSQCNNLILWNSIVQGCAENGEGKLGLRLFQRMLLENKVQPDAQTYAGVLKACSNDLALNPAKEVDAEIQRRGFESDPVLVTCRVDVYGRCGVLILSQLIFDSSAAPVVENWTALMAAYSQQGEAKQVLELFERMQTEGIQPNGVTLVCALTACDHSGLVDRGKKLFESAMGFQFGFSPWLEHYHCVVDMLGRASELDSAIQLVKRMPWKPNSRTWTTLLDGCRRVKAGAIAREDSGTSVGFSGGDDAGAYMLMAHLVGTQPGVPRDPGFNT